MSIYSNLAGILRWPGRKGQSKRRSAHSSLRDSPYFRRIRLEPLEERRLLDATMVFDHVIYSDTSQGPGVSDGYATPPTNAFDPAKLRKAYGIDRLSDHGVPLDGTGMTVAILDAYDDPKFASRNSNPDVNQDTAYLASDLHKFCVQYGLPETAGFFTKVNQSGGTSYPSGNTDWGTEIALDVEWVHAIAPGAKIVLVEANSASDSDLINNAAVWARDHSGAAIITMSFGRSESSSDSALNSVFTNAPDHGITWLASTGDDGSPGGFPAFSPNVVAVGGTTLTAPGGVYASETGWSGSGGGISAYESQPSYQQGLVVYNGGNVISQNGKRVTPDVSFDADPASGVAVYDSYSQGTSTPWLQVGGTSLSSPAWAGLIAVVDELRANYGVPLLDGLNGILPSLYNSLFAADYHDITSGSNGYAAATGYDLVTGIGTPKANSLLVDLAGNIDFVPQVTGCTPSLTGGTIGAGTSSLTINFNRTMTGADTAANYQLQSLGPDGLLGTADDTIVPLNATANGAAVTLTFAPLQEDIYRLTVYDTLTDFTGNKLDGDGDGVPGGNWVTDFVGVTNSTGAFKAATTFSTGGTYPWCLTTGDFNEDGIPDIAVTNYSSGTVGILLGNGAGSFSLSGTFSTGGSSPKGIVAGDFNNDGHLDLAVVNSSNSTVAVLLGNGKGSFWTATTYSCGSSPLSVVAADFNNDGELDLAITKSTSTSISILLGTGSGFSSASSYSSGGTYPYDLVTGDFNGDGKVDLAVANYYSGNIGVLFGTGAGGFLGRYDLQFGRFLSL